MIHEWVQLHTTFYICLRTNLEKSKATDIGEQFDIHGANYRSGMTKCQHGSQLYEIWNTKLVHFRNIMKSEKQSFQIHHNFNQLKMFIHLRWSLR